MKVRTLGFVFIFGLEKNLERERKREINLEKIQKSSENFKISSKFERKMETKRKSKLEKI